MHSFRDIEKRVWYREKTDSEKKKRKKKEDAKPKRQSIRFFCKTEKNSHALMVREIDFCGVGETVLGFLLVVFTP